MKKMSLMKSKKFATYAKKILILTKMIKMNLILMKMIKMNLGADENDKNPFKSYQKIRDHCPYTGKFRGAAHSICNLRYKTPKKVPMPFYWV